MSKFKELYPNGANFGRVFELPQVYPSGYCFGGGHAVQMQLVDWFSPWPEHSQEDFDSWDDVKSMLVDFLKNKNYVKAGRQYVLVTDFGESLVF